MTKIKFNMKTLLVIILLVTYSPVTAQEKYGRPFPQTIKEFEISVIHDDSPGRMLPMGAYRPPNSSFVFLSLNKGAKYFGALGAMLAAALDPGSKLGKKDTTQIAIFLKINLDTITILALKDKLLTQPNYSLTHNPDKSNILQIRPRSWIYVNGENYVMDFELEAYYFNETGSETWKGRYAYIAPDAIPLLGAGSLIDNDGKLLDALAQRALNRCVEIIIRDIKGSTAQWKNSNLPEELDKYPEGSVFSGWPKKGVLLDETQDDWIVKTPIQYQGEVVSIIGKNKERLLMHPIRKPD